MERRKDLRMENTESEKYVLSIEVLSGESWLHYIHTQVNSKVKLLLWNAITTLINNIVSVSIGVEWYSRLTY